MNTSTQQLHVVTTAVFLSLSIALKNLRGHWMCWTLGVLDVGGYSGRFNVKNTHTPKGMTYSWILWYLVYITVPGIRGIYYTQQQVCYKYFFHYTYSYSYGQTARYARWQQQQWVVCMDAGFPKVFIGSVVAPRPWAALVGSFGWDSSSYLRSPSSALCVSSFALNRSFCC